MADERCYKVVLRNWWHYETIDGKRTKVPGNMGRDKTLAKRLTESEARDYCRAYNANHDPGTLSRKAEFTSC